jgi:hypothetical protein
MVSGAGVTLALWGDSTIKYTTNNGTSWATSSLVQPVGDGDFGKGRFVLYDWADPTVHYVSSDGITFSNNTGPLTTQGYSLVFSGTEFIQIDFASATFYSSPDGITWYSQSGIVPDASLLLAIPGNDRVVFMGSSLDTTAYYLGTQNPRYLATISAGLYDFAQSPI